MRPTIAACCVTWARCPSCRLPLRPAVTPVFRWPGSRQRRISSLSTRYCSASSSRALLPRSSSHCRSRLSEKRRRVFAMQTASTHWHAAVPICRVYPRSSRGGAGAIPIGLRTVEKGRKQTRGPKSNVHRRPFHRAAGSVGSSENRAGGEDLLGSCDPHHRHGGLGPGPHHAGHHPGERTHHAHSGGRRHAGAKGPAAALRLQPRRRQRHRHLSQGPQPRAIQQNASSTA